MPKKKWLSVFLSVWMVFSAFPVGALGASSGTRANVANATELQTALQNDKVSEIILTQDITLSETILIDRTVTLNGNGHTVSGAGITNTNTIIGFQVESGTATFTHITLMDFDENIQAPYGSVIKIDDGKTDARVVAKHVTIRNFARDAFTFKAGSFHVIDTIIDCKPDETRPNKLTKGFQIGFGSQKVTGTIENTTVMNSASSYADWSTAAVEIFNNAEVTLLNSTITQTKTGVHMDNYWAGLNGYPSGASQLVIRNTQITAADHAVRLYSRSEQTNTASVVVESGTYEGAVTLVDPTQNDVLTLTAGTFRGTIDPRVTIAEGSVFQEQNGTTIVRVDPRTLQSLVDACQGLNAYRYTPTSWARFEAALSQANRVLSNIGATKQEMDTAYTELQSAKNGLILLTVQEEVQVPTPNPSQPTDQVQIGVEDSQKQTLYTETVTLVDALLSGQSTQAVSQAVAEKVRQAAEAGQTISTAVVFEAGVEVTQEQTAQAIDLLTSDESIAQFFDLSILLQAEGVPLGTLDRLSQPMTFRIAIPDELYHENRSYFVIRIHDGVAEKLPVTVHEDQTLTFETDRFSTYALGYAEPTTQQTPDTAGPVENPDTGDAGTPGLWIGLVVISLLGAFVTLFSKRRQRSH